MLKHFPFRLSRETHVIRTLMISALTASIPFVAVAQGNMSIYGQIDIGVGSEDVGADGTRKTAVLAGTQGQSRFGFRGTEDLGGGLTAMFNFESGFKPDTGETGSATALFARRSVVGLAGSFGSMTLGREYTPIARVAAETDPLEHGFYGTDLSAFDDNARDRIVRRASNTVNYQTPLFGGLFGRLVYGFGEQNGAPKLGDLMGLSVEYKSGAMYLGAGYHEVERVATGNDKSYILGAGYKFGDYQVKANYLASDPDGANNKFQQTNLGVSRKVGNRVILTNILQNRDETGARANGFGITYNHFLSKSTNVFTSYGVLRNNNLARFGLYSASSKLTPTTSQLGADPSGFVIGMRHLF